MSVAGEGSRSVGGIIVEGGGKRLKRPRDQGGEGPLRPWQAMQPIFPADRGGPTVHDQGMAIGQALTQGMLANQLGTPGFMTGSGTKDDPQVYHPGQGSAHERMVADVNNAWAQYAYQQGQANREKNRLKAIKDIMRMFA